MTVVFSVLILIVLASVVLLGLSVRVVREYRRLVVFRLGRVIGLRNPGVSATMLRSVLSAEGDRQAAVLRAEGFAFALRTINETASDADPRTMGLQYLEALKSLGSSAATKFVIPVELTGILQGMAGQAGRASGNGRGQT